MSIERVVTMGCDPEVFLVDMATGKNVVSCGKIGGNKHKGKPLSSPAAQQIGLNVLEDNVTLEFNISPVRSAFDMFANVSVALDCITKEILSPQGLRYDINPSRPFNSSELAAHPESLEFGCDPDFKAYERVDGKAAMRTPPSPKQLKNVRCAGGHIHIGYDRENAQTPDWAIVQFLDAFCSLHWSGTFQKNNFRHRYYGRAGLFRPKPYGLEYRTPSNIWLNLSGRDENFVCSIQNVVAGLLADEARTRYIYSLIDWHAVESCINDSRISWQAGAQIELLDNLRQMRDDTINLGIEWLESQLPKVDIQLDMGEAVDF